MTTSPQKTRVFGLDFMRATAILMVVSSHLLWVYPSVNSTFSFILRLNGFLGVELFFVLSGFLIGTLFYELYIQDNFSFKSVLYFLKRRWFRTLPNYYLLLFLNVLVALYIGYSFTDLWKYLFFFQNFASEMPAIYPESWSLSVEEFAYLLLPITIFLTTVLFKPKNKKNTFLVVLLFLIVLFTATKWYYNLNTLHTTMNQWNVSLKNVVIYRIDAILYGVLMSWLLMHYKDFMIKNRYNFVFLGIFLLFFVHVFLGFFSISIENHKTFWNVFYLPMASITMVLFLPYFSQWKTTKIPFKNAITTISLISYSCYLIHYGIVMQLMKYFIPTEHLKMYQCHFFSIGFLAITFVVSYLNYKFIEKPLMDLRDKI